MEMRARRDLFVVIFLCFFLLLTAFFHSQSIATAIAVALALYGLLAAMLTMQFRQHETPIGQRLRTVGIMLAQALPIARRSSCCSRASAGRSGDFSTHTVPAPVCPKP